MPANTDYSRIEGLRLRLDAKIKRESGSDTVSNATTGKAVTFTKSFIDIISITPVAAKQSDSYGVIAVYDFTDVPNPTGFTVYLYRSDTGAKVTGNFSWEVTGI